MLSRAADLLWPRKCAAACTRACDRPGRHVCSACLSGLPFHAASGICRICGTAIPSGTAASFVCECCAEKPPAYEFARSALRFSPPVDTLVEDFKYRHAIWLTEDLADFLEGAVRAGLAAAAIDVIVPVPLHPRRFRKRGYNQCALLARSLGGRLDRRVDEASLRRVRDTPQQARLSAEERRRNLKGAFEARSPMLRGRTVLLVDDVATTGSTLDECAKTLSGAGAARVWCATVARRMRE